MVRALISLLLILNTILLYAQRKTIIGPSGSESFGSNIIVLTNGNFVVIDPNYDLGAISNVGAVYLYNGVTHQLISKLTGTSANDYVGLNSAVALPNGNFVVHSPEWNNNLNTKVGAVTWCNGTTGLNGVVSASNSLIGSTTDDEIGYNKVYVLTNGNYVVNSYRWDNGSIVNAGAVTWCSGANGLSGAISSSNSLIGSQNNDAVGSYFISVLTNGNYVVASDYWDNGSIVDAGAVTWCNGTTGRSGFVNVSNSLVGSTAYDRIGYTGVYALPNGNYVTGCYSWDNGAVANAGAVVWGNGSIGSAGVVSAANSVVGSKTNDEVGYPNRLTILSNGNYVIYSTAWDNGSIVDAGFARWCNGSIGAAGAINASNAIVGSTADDGVGRYVIALSNGNYVVLSNYWDNGVITNAGAVTWGNGNTGKVGTISSSNSLIGSSVDEGIGTHGALSLSNGNYVISSRGWDNGANVNAGAVTWCDGTTGRVGFVNAGNSMIGGVANSGIANHLTALANGNYLINSPAWSNGTASNAGALTWCSGTNTTSGVIGVSNSLVGVSAGDDVGFRVLALSNGNYVSLNRNWTNSGMLRAGAATLCNGSTGRVGTVNALNSLIGTAANNSVGTDAVELSNGNYIVQSPNWDNGATPDVGAITWCNGTTGLIGAVSMSNSLMGTRASDQVGNNVLALTDGNFCLKNGIWDNGSISNAGAATISKSGKPIFGEISACNSVLGNATNSFNPSNAVENKLLKYLVLGLPKQNKVVIEGYSEVQSTFSESICANESYTWNGVSLTTAGNYNDTFLNIDGCDSIVMLSLVIKPLPSKATTTSGTTITASESGASYQWINCSTSTPVSGAVNQSFTASTNGSYKVAVTKSSCTDYSDCVVITSAALEDINETNTLSISPNPSNGNVQISSNREGNYAILNELGQRITSFEMEQKTGLTYKVENLNPGIYYLKNANNLEKRGYKIVVIK